MLLATRYELFDIPDVEALCVRAGRGWASKTEARLSPEDFESLTAFLIAAVWQMSERYDPELSSSFKAIVLGRLGNRSTDWFRQHRGRTRWRWSDGTSYERERPNVLSLDAAAAGEDGGPLGDAAGRSDQRLEDSCDPAFGGILENAGREFAWDRAYTRALARRLARERARPA